MRLNIFRSIATLAVAITIAIESNHSFIQKKLWLGFEPIANNISYLLVAMWLTAIAGIWSNNIYLKPPMIAGIFLIIAHSVVLSAGGNYFSFGIPYLVTGLTSIVATALAHSSFYTKETKKMPLEIGSQMAA